MLLVVGGAYAGKRKVLRSKIGADGITAWLSAYAGDNWENWREAWIGDGPLVMEGWERWIRDQLESSKSLDDIRNAFLILLRSLHEEEKKRQSSVGLIMLEMGRGIVPMSKQDRQLRDLAGWILQDAAAQADEVMYVWHGLARMIKP
jgi:adenosylcobinamide kinase/adenosylcobinamide-phosphate guanylyltransferase